MEQSDINHKRENIPIRNYLRIGTYDSVDWDLDICYHSYCHEDERQACREKKIYKVKDPDIGYLYGIEYGRSL